MNSSTPFQIKNIALQLMGLVFAVLLLGEKNVT